MIPTVGQVKDRARDVLGDSDVTGGQEFTDTELQGDFAEAFRELYRIFDQYGIEFVARYMHFNLPAYQTSFRPSQAGVDHFGEPMALFGRTPRSTYTITAATSDVAGGGCTITTSVAHDIEDGDTVVIYGVSGGGPPGIDDTVNDQWTVLKIDATNFRLLGCMATGGPASTGTASPADEDWRPIGFTREASSIAEGDFHRTGSAAWMGDRFLIPKLDQERQIRIKFSLSGDAPSADTASVGIDDSLDFLSHRTASLAGGHFGADDLARDAERRSIGSEEALAAGNPGGILGDMITRGLKAKQKQVYQTQRWRPIRNTGRHRRALSV